MNRHQPNTDEYKNFLRFFKLLKDTRRSGRTHTQRLPLLFPFYNEDRDSILKKHPKAYKGPVVIMSEADNGSAGEIFAMTMKGSASAKVFGLPSAGMASMLVFYGDKIGPSKNLIYLPGYRLFRTDQKFTYDGKGVVPNKVQPPTVKDFTNNYKVIKNKP